MSNIELFTPYFKNLYKNKVVYHERITFLARMENIEILEDRFRAIIIPELQISNRNRGINPYGFPKSWNIGCTWEHLRIFDDCLAATYVSWLLWTDPILVEKVEKLTLDEKYKEALELTLFTM